MTVLPTRAADLEAELYGTQQRLKAVLGVLPLLMVEIDREGVVTGADGHGFDLVGMEPAAVLGLNVLSAWGADHDAAQRIRRALAGERQEGTFVSRSGNEWEYELLPRRDLDDEVVGVDAVAFDTRERKRSEAALRESAAKSRFLAAMSHELRTPLNSILGFSQLLDLDAGTTLTDKQKRYLRNIEVSGRHLLSLINEVLDLSKVAAGEMEISLQAVEVAELAHATADAVRPLAEAGRQVLEVEVPAVCPVHADPRRLGQALTNLLANAIKFTPEGGRIVVRAQQAAGWVELSVADDGVGIAEADCARVFEEFTQLEAGRLAGGTGLGLALTRQLVEAMGGSVGVSSRLGAGSTFTIRLPLA